MSQKEHDKYFTRLLMIMDELKKAPNNSLHVSKLAELYGVDKRTIYRDVDRLHFFPISLENGVVSLSEDFEFGREPLKDNELLVSELAMSSISGLDERVDKTLHSIRAKLLTPLFSTPYNIKAELYEPIDTASPILNKIEDAIEKHNISKVTSNKITSEVEPYKVVAFDGIWYLLAREIRAKKIKTYLVANIEEFRATSQVFESRYVDVDKVLQNVHTAWFEDGNSFEVTVKIKKEIAQYFKLKKHLSSQKILKEDSDGSLVVSFSVSSDEDVDNLIKSWLPHIEVIKPERFRKKLISELELYVKELKQLTI